MEDKLGKFEQIVRGIKNKPKLALIASIITTIFMGGTVALVTNIYFFLIIFSLFSIFYLLQFIKEKNKADFMTEQFLKYFKEPDEIAELNSTLNLGERIAIFKDYLIVFNAGIFKIEELDEVRVEKSDVITQHGRIPKITLYIKEKNATKEHKLLIYSGKLSIYSRMPKKEYIDEKLKYAEPIFERLKKEGILKMD